MKQRLRKNILTTSIAIALGLPAAVSADTIVSFDWAGVFTMLDYIGQLQVNGVAAPGGTAPNAGDPFGLQTGIVGTLAWNLDSRTGTATVEPFWFTNQRFPPPWTSKNITLKGVGDGASGPGSLVQMEMQVDWNGSSFNIPLAAVLDFAGLNSQIGGILAGSVIGINGSAPGSVATTPSCTTATGPFAPFMAACGPAPVWTTDNDLVWDASTASWLLASVSNPLTQDGISGNPMPNRSTDPADPVIFDPFGGFSANFDISTLTVTNITDTNPVPVPAAVWLFGSGLVGLFGVARTRRSVALPTKTGDCCESSLPTE